MKINLVFFDSFENSKRGLLKGFLIYPFALLTFSLIDLVINQKQTNVAIIDVFASSLLIVSALGVSSPDCDKQAIFFGASVGLVVSAVSFFQNAVISDEFSLFALLSVLILTCSCALQNFFLNWHLLRLVFAFFL